MITARIQSLQTLNVVESNTDYLDVTIQIFNGDNFLEKRRLSYLLGTSQEEIEADIAKFCASYENDIKIGEETKEVERLTKQTNDIRDKLVGKVIS